MGLTKSGRERNTSNNNSSNYPTSSQNGSRQPMSPGSQGLDDDHVDGEKEMDSWRLALLGDGGVGKTALAVQFTLNAFVETYDPTIEDAYRKSTKIGDQKCFIEIIDTAGQEEYATIRDQWVWESAAFVLVFSLGSWKSLDRVRLFFHTVVRVQRHDPIVILVGNKLDQKRVVRTEDAVEFAKSIGATYIETSAKTAHNVSTVFIEPIARLRNKHAHVADSYDLKGRLPLPPNPQSVEAPPGAIAAVAAQEAAKANKAHSAGRDSSERLENLGPIGPILEAAMPLNRLLLGEYPNGPTDNPAGYAKGGQTGPSLFEHHLPPGTVYPGRITSMMPGTSTSRGGGGTRSRSGTNASLSTGSSRTNIGGGLSGSGSGSTFPPLPSGSASGRVQRKMSDPQHHQYNPKLSNSSSTTSSRPPMPEPSPNERVPVKKKSGSLGAMFGKRGKKDDGRGGPPSGGGGKDKKDDGCVVQ